MFEFGCKWTLDYFLTGCAGGLVAVLILPGGYLAMPRFRTVDGELRICLGAFARVIVAGIAGCVVDCSSRNAFFAGFFAWHAFRWFGDDGWKWLRAKLERMVCRSDG